MSLDLWDKLRSPPESALKKISGGRLSGKTDISPQWRWQRMTEVFGPVGTGWKFETAERWLDNGSHDQIMCFVRVKLYVMSHFPDNKDDWSAPIEGIGGSMLVDKEKNGLYSNDEAWKMATTDALGTACKYLGLAADIYLGGASGSKYDRPAPSGGGRPDPTPGKWMSSSTSGATPPTKATKVTSPQGTEPSKPPILRTEAEVNAWKAMVWAKWEEGGHTAESVLKAAVDLNGLPVYCKGCKGPTWPSKSTNPKAPQFLCMGFGKEKGQFCESNGPPAPDGTPYRLGWWPGEFYGEEHGAFPYRLASEV